MILANLFDSSLYLKDIQMKLKKIKIQNYRSIDQLTFDVPLMEDSSRTFGLIGVNEAGKSSFLKAIAIKDTELPVKTKDFKNSDKVISIEFEYDLDFSERESLNKGLTDEDDATFNIITLINRVTIDPRKPAEKIKGVFVFDEKKGEFEIDETSLDIEGGHTTVFWSADPRYLINQPISLSNFSNNPETSIPLRNCFYLAGIDDIKSAIDKANADSADAEELQTMLGEAVTEHIKSVWHNHPIVITFMIMNGSINFHIKDHGKGKAKTADQRSDGFKQFISFLLTVSAQNKNQELENTILLLDEPETHLHPQAQEFFLKELIELSKNDRNNLVFFATHSNYMIDKIDLGRNYKVAKIKDDATELTKFESKNSTYASISYHVFDIATTDYHNELYGTAQEIFKNQDNNDKNREYLLTFDSEVLKKIAGLNLNKPYKGEDNKCTLPTYVRNCIHHPEVGKTFSEKELRSSIDTLINLIDKLNA